MAAREFRHAQNEVLEIMKVVERKDREQSKARKKAEKDKVTSIIQENSDGQLLDYLSQGIILATLWWVASLRGRVLVSPSNTTITEVYLCRPGIQVLCTNPAHRSHKVGTQDFRPINLFGFGISGLDCRAVCLVWS